VNSGPTLIGPGRLIAVVGPSGAGKDTLISLTRAACHGDQNIVFPRRVVTRPLSAHEDHDSLPDDAFDRAAADGAFALSWSAHGLRYGVPATIDGDIRAGRTVVCNVSRSIVEEIRGRYASVIVVLITAPYDVLAKRLAARGRPTDGPLNDRMSRASTHENSFRPDAVVQNVAGPDVGAQQLLNILQLRFASGGG
jgi:ribose 1,5-bisphosphokinase